MEKEVKMGEGYCHVCLKPKENCTCFEDSLKGLNVPKPDIFKDAVFGDEFITRDGHIAIYHGSQNHVSSDGTNWTYHSLILEPRKVELFDKEMVVNCYEVYINDNGIGRPSNLKYYKDSGASKGSDIIGKKEKSVKNYDTSDDKIYSYALECNPYAHGSFLHTVWNLAFKAGFKKLVELINKY